MDDVFAAKVLRRPIVDFPDGELARAVAGRRVLITGAGGFIGSCLAGIVARLGPAQIALAENSERSLYEVDRVFEENWPQIPRWSEYCDIRDPVALARLFDKVRPDVVFNAAALKHVPLLQDHPREAALTNALAVRSMAELAIEQRVAIMIHVSTDKAVNSAGTMGRSKRLAERYLRALDACSPGTRIASVRFGNVFGSTGSVVPLFERQICAGGPVTLTDGRMTRYFMTASEAAGFLLVVAGMLESFAAPRSPLYILDMGEPVRISDVARRMVAIRSGAAAGIEMREIGRRPGEKLFEELVGPGEALVPSGRPGIDLLDAPAEPLAAVSTLFDALQAACEVGDEGRIVSLMRSEPSLPVDAASATVGLAMVGSS